MNEQNIISQLQNLLNGFSLSAVFYGTLAAVLLDFAICVTVSLIKHGGLKIMRIAYSCAAVSITCFSLALTLLLSEKVSVASSLFIPSAGLGLAAVLFLPLMAFNGGIKVKTAHKDLISALDAVVKNGENSEKTPSFIPDGLRKFSSETDDSKTFNKIEPSNARFTVPEIDFSHVRNVMERLDYFGLSPTDRNTVNQLKNTLAEAESFGIDDALKGKINDGLGQLLKIMSKYNV